MVLLKNRMAFVGLILLFSYIFLALAAPLLTPYNPQGDVVSAPNVPPSWVTFYVGTAGYSQNAQFSNLQATGDGLSIDQTTTPPNSVNVQVTSDPSGGNVLVQKSLHYPSTGAALRFLGNVIVSFTGLPTAPPATLSLFIDRISAGVRDDHRILWNQTITGSGEVHPPGSIDSIDRELNARLGFPNSNIASQIIFSKAADYVYGLQISLPAGADGGKFSVKDFQMVLFGNTWGYLGTDAEGHDLFSQLIYGARLSLEVGLLATLLGVGLGLIVGLLAGYLGKVVDEVLMRFTDMMLVIPGLPLLIVLSQVLGPSLNNIILIIGFLGWMGFARVVRSQVLSLRERPFVEAAKASGAGTGYTLVRHIFPNIVSLTYVNLALSVPAAIVTEAALSFLGLGDDTVVTWGRMLSQARGAGGVLSWWWVIPPGLSIALVSLSFVLLGYALDELFNPRLRRRR